MKRPPTAELLTPMLGQCLQLGYVVDDLDAALAFWTGNLAVGPFVIIEDPVGSAIFFHHNVQRPVRMTVALAYAGDTMIELIVQTSDTPSPYTDFLSSGGMGLHHIGFWPDDFDTAGANLDEAGFMEVSSIVTSDGVRSVAYLTSPPAFGPMIEIIRPTPFRTTYSRGIRNLTETWNGHDPVRRYASFADFVASGDCMA